MELRRRILPVLIRALGIKGSRKRNEVRAVGNIKRVNKGYMKRSTCLVIFMKRSTYRYVVIFMKWGTYVVIFMKRSTYVVNGDIHEEEYICDDTHREEYMCTFSQLLHSRPRTRHLTSP